MPPQLQDAGGGGIVIRDPSGHEHEFPPGFDPKRAAEIVRGQYPQAKAEPSRLSKMLTPVEEGFSVGPTIGATIGGGVGARFGMPRAGTAVGAAAGRGYEDLLTHVKEIPGAIADVAANLGVLPGVRPSQGGAPGRWQQDQRAAGATATGFLKGMREGVAGMAGAATAQTASGELGTQTIGRLQARYGPKISKWLMTAATRDVAQRILNDFPGLRTSLIERALTISRGGYDRAAALLARWKGEADHVIQIAEQQGLTVPVKMDWDQFTLFKNAILANLKKTGTLSPAPGAVTPLMSRVPAATRQLLIRAGKAAGHNRAIDLTPTQADLFKQELQAFVRKTGFYQRATEITKGKPITSVMTESMDLAARDVNNWIERIAKGYQAANKEAQTALGATRAMKSVERSAARHGFKTPAVGVGVIAARAAGGLAGGGAGYETGGAQGAAYGTTIGLGLGFSAGEVLKLLDNPWALSHGSILLTKPAVQTVINQLPTHLATLLVKVLREGRNTAPEDLQKIKSVLDASQGPETTATPPSSPAAGAPPPPAR